MSAQDKKDLEDLRNDFISDGLRWSLDNDKKLVHLWRKLKRKEQVVKTQSHEINELKKQQKEEMAGMQDFLSKIRNLSDEREQLTQSLEAENEQLRKQVAKAIKERDAFVQENQAIAELLIAEGLQPFSGATPKQQVVEYLLQEHTKIKNQLEQVTKEKAEVVKKLGESQKELKMKEKELKTDLQSAQQSTIDASKQLKSMEVAHNAEKTRLIEERDKLKADIEEKLGKLALMRAEIKAQREKLTTDGRAYEIETKRLKKQLEYMTSAQNEFQASHEGEVKKLHSEKKAVQRDLSYTKIKVKNLEEEKNKLQTEIGELKKGLEAERMSTASIKADLAKQLKMHKNQICEVKERLTKSEAEVKRYQAQKTTQEQHFQEVMAAKDEEQTSCAGELQEALETINELTKDLEEATRSNQEILQENEALQEELQTLRDTNNELTQQTDQLDKMIKEERMKSVSIVQEQLQKQHELTRQTDAANQELIERDECLTRLQAELEKTQTNEEALKNQLHKLEQALFEQQAAGKEKELLQKLDLQGQLGHFQHGEETVEKRLQDKSSRHEKDFTNSESRRCGPLTKKMKEYSESEEERKGQETKVAQLETTLSEKPKKGTFMAKVEISQGHLSVAQKVSKETGAIEESEAFRNQIQELEMKVTNLVEDNQKGFRVIMNKLEDIDTGIAKKALEAENEQLQHQLLRLQSQLDVVEAEKQSLRGAQQESIAFGIQPWKVPRENVEIERIIGGGGWGVVSKGKLQVAVKQFHPNILSAQNLSRLKREMRMLALVRHPNLLQFIAVVFDDDDHDYEQNPPYIITELLDMSLRSAYEKEKLQNSDLIPIFYDTAKALDYLHCRHEPIIHRDVSSANILLKKQHNGKWIAKLSDLGSANLANKAYTLNEGARVYCAPEAFTFDSNARSVISLTPKIDVYSYGIMLCEVATKTFPDDTALPAMQIRIQHERPQLYHLIVACTRYSADQRPTMEEVLKLLETFQ